MTDQLWTEELTTANGTVSLFADSGDGTVLVVADQDYDSGDWAAVCDRLAELGTAPLTGPEFDGELDVWQTVLPTAVQTAPC